MPFINKDVYFTHLFLQYNIDNVLICGHVQYGEYARQCLLEMKPTHKTLLYISEPVNNMNTYKYSQLGIENNEFDILFGCINHDPKNNRFKYPLYVFTSKISDITMLARFEATNLYVKELTDEEILAKSYCTLIARWDPGNTRTCIANYLVDLGDITRPSLLFNNCPIEETERLDAMGKHNYLKEFKFNICPENYDYGNVPGYITEKLMDCCLGGAIPVYAGSIDEYDRKVFNMNRVLFYNSKDPDSIQRVFSTVAILLNDPDKFLEFYRQPVFCDTAYETIELLKRDSHDMMKSWK